MIRAAACALLCACLCGACSEHRHDAVENAARRPLLACETRVVSIDGSRVVVTANADGTPATMASASGDAASRQRALREAGALYGAPHRDLDAVASSSKFGPAIWSDRCGRPLQPPQNRVR